MSPSASAPHAHIQRGQPLAYRHHFELHGSGIFKFSSLIPVCECLGIGRAREYPKWESPPFQNVSGRMGRLPFPQVGLAATTDESWDEGGEGQIIRKNTLEGTGS